MNKTTRFILLIIILALCFYAGRAIDLDIDAFKEALGRYPLVLSCIFFVLAYIVVTFFVWFVAKDIFRISSALVFGPYLSAFLVYLGELGNAIILFFLSRKLGQDYIVAKFHLDKDHLDRHKENRGFFGAFTLRINPLIPYRLQDLGSGLSTISFRRYFSAIAIASAPRILFFQYVIAGVGMSIFKDTDAAMQYMTEHTEILVFGFAYFSFVILTTICYGINKWIQKRKLSKLPEAHPEA